MFEERLAKDLTFRVHHTMLPVDFGFMALMKHA